MSADRLRAAASKLRAQAETTTDRTIRMPMVQGVHLNHAHYLTTTPAATVALAAWLDEAARETDELERRHGDDINPNWPPISLTDAILGHRS